MMEATSNKSMIKIVSKKLRKIRRFLGELGAEVGCCSTSAIK
ncbi:hypothetical protein J517_0670 [Acinetobacter baumannii 118362]|nr:hypothetical protein J517_0670 [Acinetobacter baumannii 118362]